MNKKGSEVQSKLKNKLKKLKKIETEIRSYLKNKLKNKEGIGI